MGFRKDAWATVWSVEEGKGNSLKVRLSTSKKDKATGMYEQDFSGYCTFIGKACTNGGALKQKDRIKLGDVDVTTWYNKDKGVEYVTYKVFDYETDSSSNNGSYRKAPKHEENTEGIIDDDDLPFTLG